VFAAPGGALVFQFLMLDLGENFNMNQNDIHSDYLESLFHKDKFKRRIVRAQKELKDKKFDSIAFRGNSGAIFGGVLAYMMNKDMFLIRKEPSHSCYNIEGNLARKKYIFVDDFIVSGVTFWAVYSEMKLNYPSIQLVGSYEYTNYKFSDGYSKLLENGYDEEYILHPEYPALHQ
jgi:hypothetical protein